MAADVALNQDGVLLVELRRPEARNALNVELLTAVNAGLGEHLRSGRVRAVAVRGAGGYFSAGADLKEMAEAREAGDEGKRRLRSAMAEFIYLMTELHTCFVPTIALVEGGASGGGVGLLGSCQWVVAEEKAKFRLPEAGLGLYPFMISPPLIRRMGYEAFLRLTFEGRSWTAEESRAAGLVDEVVETLPEPSTLLRFEARPGVPWPTKQAGPMGSAAELVGKAKTHLRRAARIAALLHDSMSLPIAMRTAANELGALVARLAEGS